MNAPVNLPADFVVWAVADLHGMAAPFARALTRAGLTDAGGTWSAPAHTALIVCGDSIDRGPDSWPLVLALQRLAAEAAVGDSQVVILEGNHEWTARVGLAGDADLLDLWLANGGRETLTSLGLSDDSRALRRSARTIAVAVHSLEPAFGSFLAALVPYARWRDVLFVHGGPVPGTASLAAFAADPERLFIREDFLAGPSFPGAPVWAAFAAAGIGRAVVGHTPGRGVRLYHAGRVAVIDTNPARDRNVFGATRPEVTLLRVPPTGSLEGSYCVVERSW
jgi:serine/threonine protein phosphatase 1